MILMNKQFNERFIKNYNGDSNKGYLIEADVQNPESLRNLHNSLPFLPGRLNYGGKKIKM